MSQAIAHFDHVVVCCDGVEEVVPLLHVPSRSSSRQKFKGEDLAKYPHLQEYAVNDILLVYPCENLDDYTLFNSMCSRHKGRIGIIYDEFQAFINFKDSYYQNRIIGQIIEFLEDTKVEYYTGDYIDWDPTSYENYEDRYESYGINNVTIEELEHQVAETIKGIVRDTKLDMCRLFPIDSEDAKMLRKMIDHFEGSNNFDKIMKALASSHYCQIYRKVNKPLVGQEYRNIKQDIPIDNHSTFVFSSEEITDILSLKDIVEDLDYFTGGILNDLDLSKTFITGSAIAATLSQTLPNYQFIDQTTNRQLIDIFYPCIYTQFSNSDHQRLKRLTNLEWNIALKDENYGAVTCDDHKFLFTVKCGADLDLAIDENVSDEEYERIAQSHYEAVLKKYPSAKMVKLDKQVGWNYSIYSTDPEVVPFFRQIEIYRSSFQKICTHHVAPVRGAFTSFFGEGPKFYITASSVESYIHGYLKDYHYFAGKKSKPQDVLIKYQVRRFILEGYLYDILAVYRRKKGLSILSPFKSTGINFSIYSGQLECKLYRKI